MPLYYCMVNRTGIISNGDVYVALKDSAGVVDIWGIAENTYRREILTVALTAMSNKKLVEVELAVNPQGKATDYQIFTRIMMSTADAT